MWLVVGGPAIVVVASFVTLYIAITTRDQIYVYDGPDSSAAMSEQTAPPPALETRNHLAIGGKKSRDKRSD